MRVEMRFGSGETAVVLKTQTDAYGFQLLSGYLAGRSDLHHWRIRLQLDAHPSPDDLRMLERLVDHNPAIEVVIDSPDMA